MDNDLVSTLIGENPMVIQKLRIAILTSLAGLHFWTAIDGSDQGNQDKKQTERTEEAHNVGSSYYCHQCHKEVVTDPVNMACPLCRSFIEESASDCDGNGATTVSPLSDQTEESASDCDGNGATTVSPLSDQTVVEVVDNTIGSALNRLPFRSGSHDYGHVISRSMSRRLSPGQPTRGTRITSSVWIFTATGFSFEAVSAFFDQVSSPRKPQYALYGMLLSIVALLVSTLDLILQAMKPRGITSESNMLWDILPEIFGLTLACLQCISSTLQFSFLCRHAVNPVKVSLVPFLFLFVLFAFKYRNERN